MSENGSTERGGGRQEPPAAGRGFGGVLHRATGAVALVGGVLLVAIMLLTVVSVAGRYVFGTPVTGDFEIVEMTTAIIAFLCFPYTFMSRGNIVAEFFTSAARPGARRLLDFVHDLIFAAVAAFLTWRLAIGGLGKYRTNATTMLTGIPEWWGFLLAVLGCAALTVACLWFIWRYLRGTRT